MTTASAEYPRGYLFADSLAVQPTLRHGFSLALRSEAEQDEFAAAVAAGMPVLRLTQVHGADVLRAEDLRGRSGRAAGDALVAAEPGVALAVATADCVPLLLADGKAGIVAAVHAGWRGMRARVIARALEEMVKLGAEPRRMRAGIGPAVQGGCYEVGDEVRAEFERNFPEARTLFTDRRLDLVRAAGVELRLAGVPDEGVSVLAICTHCRPTLSSQRREGAARGTNLSLIALAG